MKCYLCGSKEFFYRKGSVRDNKKIRVIECKKCSLVSLDSKNHISSRHYQEGGMHDDKKKLYDWLKEGEKDDLRRFDFFKKKIKNKNILDFGSGAGGFLIKAKTIANSVEGIELEESLKKHYTENDIIVRPSLVELLEGKIKKYDLITAFHVFEHLVDPISILKNLSKLLIKGGEIIIEVPNSDDALLTLYQNEEFSNFTYWSQHLYLFNNKTFEDLVKKVGLKLNWIKQIQRYSLSNHLFWLSKGKPGGHKIWTFFEDKDLNDNYSQRLASIGKCDTILVSVSL